MSNMQLKYTIASLYDHENLVLEISVDHRVILEFSKEPGLPFRIEIYPLHDSDFWKLGVEEFKKALDRGLEFLESLPSDSNQSLSCTNQQFSYTIASIADSKNPVLHIFVENKQLLEVSKESDHSFEVNICPPDGANYKYPLSDNDFWTLDYLTFRKILDEGMKEFEQLLGKI